MEYVDALTGQRYTTFEFSGGKFELRLIDATSSSPAKFGLVLKGPNGTLFHSTGTAPAPVVLGRVVSTL